MAALGLSSTMSVADTRREPRRSSSAALKKKKKKKKLKNNNNYKQKKSRRRSPADNTSNAHRGRSNHHWRRAHLNLQKLTANTRTKYLKALTRFLQDVDASITELIKTPASTLDRALSEWIANAWTTGRWPRSSCRDAMQATLYVRPNVRGSLFNTAAAMTAWERSTTSTSAWPLPPPLAKLIAEEMCKNGHACLAVATLLASHTYMRKSEVLALRVNDVLPPMEPYEHTTLLLRTTKARRAQAVQVDDKEMARLLDVFLAFHVNTEAKLFPYSGTQWTRAFQAAGRSLGLKLPFSLHSLRHGGAAHDNDLHLRSLDQIRHRGRWADFKTVEIYLQATRGREAWALTPAHLRREALTLEEEGLFTFIQPLLFALQAKKRALTPSPPSRRQRRVHFVD